MTELVFIIFQIFLFFFLFSFSPIIFKENIIKRYYLSENIFFNLIIHSNFILILSFFNINILKIIIIYIFSLIIILLINLIKNFKEINLILRNHFLDFFILFLISFIIFCDFGNNLFLSWDSEKFWFNKTLNFYNGYSVGDLGDIYKSNYPYFGGLITSIFWKISLINNEYVSKFIFGFIYILSLYVLISNLKISNINKLICLFMFLLITYDYSLLFSGNQEVLVFSIIGYILHNIYQIKIKKNKDIHINLIAIFLSLNLLIWTKQEGVFYSLFLIITLFFVFKTDVKKKFMFFSLIILLLTIRYWIYKLYNLDISINKSILSSSSPLTYIERINIDRTIVVLKYFLFSLFQNYLLIIGIILYCLNKIYKSKIRYLDFYVIINVVFLFTVYLLIDRQEFSIKYGFDRLVFNISPFIFLLFIELVNKKNN